MPQVTLRLDERLWTDVKRAAEARGLSANRYVADVLAAVADPATAGSDRERIRERLARADLLETPSRGPAPPDERAVAEARRRAGRGTPLSDLVAEGRR
jgi:hypothetical protein